ncbi:hypothetical protein [Gluconobacter cerinus]|uniref:hypothetical protein n=1 Tax=Gluconobacter cerinus TaxID=38307 RepID=UPI001B8B7D27|nr:hypothetical protein [Gluconobacter cerinus]MBS0984342.1 hypothetical protein [Gluconobacter cerinus]
MDTKSKLTCIKKLKDSEFFGVLIDFFQNGKFDSRMRVYVKCEYPGNEIAGFMDIDCVRLIDPVLDVTYFVECMGNISMMFDKNKKIKKVLGCTIHKHEPVSVHVENQNAKITFLDEHFIEFDCLDFYKIVDCSIPSVIGSELFKRRFKTYVEEVSCMLAMSEF